MNKRWMHLLSLATVFMIVASLSLVRDRRLLGHELAPKAENGYVRELPGGTAVVNTTELCKDVAGYAGPVPLEITVTNGVIDSVHPLANSETPGFFVRVVDGGLLKSWNGMTPGQAVSADVDGVTGATYSSRAVIANVHAGLSYLIDNGVETAPEPMKWSVAGIVALVVALMAAIVPLKVKSGWYRTVQELLNVGVLGFWAGTFVNYTMMLNFMSNGIHSLAAVTAVVLLVTAFVYPIFGHAGHYCAWVCPLGSMQDLAGRCVKRKWHFGPREAGALRWVRRGLWCALMLCMWLGAWMSWVDYELFSAFVLESAAPGMLVAGGAVVFLSVFVPRPYCRFVCPTGTLLRMSQDIESPNI